MHALADPTLRRSNCYPLESGKTIYAGGKHGYAASSRGQVLRHIWLTFAGCASAVLAAGFRAWTSVSWGLAFAVLTMPYAAGHISGGHFNCAVTVGLWAGAKSMRFGC
jgi:Major intrinsic protein